MLDATFLGSTDSQGAADASTGQPAATDAPATPAETSSVETSNLSTDGQQPAPAQTAEQAAAAADDTQKSSLTNESKAADGELSEEEQLEAVANDPNTPRWAREQIKRALSYSGNLKQQLTELRAQFEAVQTKAQQYEGREALEATEIERLKAADDALYRLKSFDATADDIDAFIRETNPRLYADFQNQTVWKFIEREDGSPDYENIQTIVDSFTGEAGRVSAKDVLAAIEALKSGYLLPEDLHTFSSEEERASFERARARERELEARERAIAENLKYQERQIRSAEVAQAIGTLQNTVQPRVMEYLQQFKMMPVEGEPKPLADFKQEVFREVSRLITDAPNEVRELGELMKAFTRLQEPRGLDAQAAVAEVRGALQDRNFRQFFDKGTQELLGRIERAVSAAALRYKYMAKGYEVLEASAKNESPRPVIGAPNQADPNTRLTADQLAQMTARERADAAAVATSRALRELFKPTASRLGG